MSDRVQFIKQLVRVCMAFLRELCDVELYSYQIEMAERIFFSLLIGDTEEITVETARQAGKALALTTPILTTKGWKTMGSLQVGDRLFAPDGQTTRVRAKSKVFHDHDCYRLTFLDGQKITADGDHRWVFQDTEHNHQEVLLTTRELWEKGIYWERFGESQLKYRYTMPIVNKRSDRELPLDPYLLGAWLGDGTAARAEVTTADAAIITSFVRAGFERSYTYDSTYNGKAKMYGFTGLWPVLRKLGLVKNKHIPTSYLLSSEHQRLELLRGLMDTDGSCSTRGEADICLTHKTLAHQVASLVRSLGWKATISQRMTDSGKLAWRVRFRPYSDFNPFSLPRKGERVRSAPPEMWRRRKTTSNGLLKIEKVRPVSTQCISVDHPSGMFLAGRGFIPTHNSETLADVCATAMVLMPKLARMYPADRTIRKFKRGIMIGVFAPTDQQADTIFSRIQTRLETEEAQLLLKDPEIDDELIPTTRLLKMRSGSFCRMQTAFPKAKIESKTYHLILIDEAQDADSETVRRRIHPMMAAVGGSIVKVGTPAAHKSDYYEAIQRNRTRGLTYGQRNHFAYDWKRAAKENIYYADYIKKEKLRLGEDSDEFLMAYCVAPETRILTADLRHVPAGSLVPGTKLIGFDEDRGAKGAHRQLRESVVEDIGRVVRPCYRVDLDDGTSVVCSAEHQWLVTTAGRRTVWKKTEDLNKPRYRNQKYPNDRIFKVTDTWESDHSYEQGYLAAAFDGEGYLSLAREGPGWQLAFSQRDNLMAKRVRRYLREYGFTWFETVGGTNGDCICLHIAGGRNAVMRFLGQIRPQRLLPKLDRNRLGSIGRHDHVSQDFRHPQVEKLTYLGPQEVVAIRTSTRTYIAEGLASHNCLKWLLERGMFVTDEQIERLGDKTMPIVPFYTDSPIVIGIDVAAKHDSTVVTAVWVDWEHPDEFHLYNHRILNWLELHGEQWESQYRAICDFVSRYNVMRIGVDAQGMGGPVAERLQVLLPHIDVVAMPMNPADQSERWQHLMQLIQRGLIGWPADREAKRTKKYQRFVQQMSEVEKEYRGKYVLVGAPRNEKNAHDDYLDSLALACSLTKEFGDEAVPEVQVWEHNPFYERSVRSGVK